MKIEVRLRLKPLHDAQVMLEASMTNAAGITVAVGRVYYELYTGTEGHFAFFPYFDYGLDEPEFWLDGKTLLVTTLYYVIISPEDVVRHIGSQAAAELFRRNASCESWLGEREEDLSSLVRHMETVEAVALALARPQLARHLSTDAAARYAELHPELWEAGHLL